MLFKWRQDLKQFRFKTIYLYDVHCKNINLSITSKITETGVKFYSWYDKEGMGNNSVLGHASKTKQK